MLRKSFLLSLTKFFIGLLGFIFISNGYCTEKTRKPKSLGYEKIYAGKKGSIGNATVFTEIHDVNIGDYSNRIFGSDENGKMVELYFGGDKCFKMALLAQTDSKYNLGITAGVSELKDLSFPSEILRLLYDNHYLKGITHTNHIVHSIVERLNQRMKDSSFTVIQDGKNVGVSQHFAGQPAQDDEKMISTTRLKDTHWGDKGISPLERSKFMEGLMSWFNKLIKLTKSRRSICYLKKV